MIGLTVWWHELFRVSISGNPIEFDLSQQSKFGSRYQSHQWHLQIFIPSQGLLIWHKDDCILWYLSNFLKLQAHKAILWLLVFKDAVLLTVYVFFMLTNFKEIQSPKNYAGWSRRLGGNWEQVQGIQHAVELKILLSTKLNLKILQNFFVLDCLTSSPYHVSTTSVSVFYNGCCQNFK